jgi:YD repeat-containing protein
METTFEQESSNRQDLVALKALKRVCIWGLNVQTQSYEKVKIYEFVTSYFGANTSTPEEKRLRLDKLLVKDKNDVMIESYVFEYNTDQLPSRKSKDRDMFGLYNGPNNNTSLIPTMTILAEGIAGQPVNYTIGSGNREISERYSKACILQKITYPTGGYTAFEYENNRFFTSSISNGLAGGLRIAAMKSSPDNTQTKAVTKRYKYGNNEDGTGILNNLLFYSPIAQLESNQFLNSSLLRSVQRVTATGVLGSSGGGNVESRRRIYVPNYTFSLNGFEGAPVRYVNVTEYEDLATNTNLALRPMGKTTYRFRQGRADIPKTIKSLIISNRTVMESFHWDRGQLEEKIVYNSNNQIVQKVVNEYANLANTSISHCGLVVSYGHDYTNSPPVPDQALFQAPDEYQVDYYGYTVGNTKLSKTTEWMDGVEKVSFTDYDSTYYVPIESRFLASNGETKIQKTKYPFHFQTQVGLGTQTGFARGVQLLIQNNRIATPVEQVSSVLKRNGQRYVTGGTISLFQEPVNHINYVFPKAIYVYAGMNTLNPMANYIPLSFSNSLTLDSKYEKRIEFEDYDNYNNLLSYLIDGLRSSYDWNRVNFDNLTFSYLKSETSNLGGTPSLTKNYGYKIPLIGIINVQQPNGLLTNYEYDDIGRLTKIRDNKGNLVKSYSYNYRNQ